jgi:hypothetical protein
MPFRELWSDLTRSCPCGLLQALFMHLVIPALPTALWLFFRH